MKYNTSFLTGYTAAFRNEALQPCSCFGILLTVGDAGHTLVHYLQEEIDG